MVKASGRSGAARERWGKIVAEWRRSGLGVREFCRKRGVGEHSFYAWRRELRHGGERHAKPGFLPVRVVSRGAAQSGIEIEFPTGHVVRAGSGVEPDALARAFELVESGRC